MLFNVIGNAIFFERGLKKNLDLAYDAAGEKKAQTNYFCEFFGFLAHPLYQKQV